MTTKFLDAYLKRIQSSSVYDVAIKTPLQELHNLSKIFHNRIYIKREDLQPVFSFKLRGAYNKISALSDAEKQRGIIASSAGNHAQGVAYSAKKLGIKATIVMPKTTPPIKVKSVRDYGAKAVLVGDAYDDAYAHAQKLIQRHGYVFIHPYDDPLVIAGQGTVALEILDQLDNCSAIFVPVGGGGLMAGVIAAVKSLKPEIKIIGVEPNNSTCLYSALKAGTRVVLDQVGIFADGVAVKQIGEEPFRIVQNLVDDMVLVNTDEICAAVKEIFEHTRTIAEPSGALSLAGLKKYCTEKNLRNQNLVCINSGANINFDRLRHISERADVGEFKEALYAITIPEQKGSFLKFCKLIKKRSITEFNYRFSDDKIAHLFVGVGLSNGIEDKHDFETLLQKENYSFIDLSNNEVATLHVRHMIGGKPKHLQDERVYRFQFPERPGALMQFLTSIGGKWNISMFHYRNHGAAFGRVLAGIQIPNSDKEVFELFLKKLAYTYFDETDNIAYKQFL